MRVAVSITHSDHPDDRRLPQPAEIAIEVDVLPREGEYLYLPWDVGSKLPAPDPGATIMAIVESVDHAWHRLDAETTPDGPVPILSPHLEVVLIEPDISEGPWE
jgi:hypothetical protein